MTFKWSNHPNEVKDFVEQLQKHIVCILKNNFVGFYIHGSLAMGGFNPSRSDIDIIIITKNSISVKVKKELAGLCLNHSNSPFPIEMSILTKQQLFRWQHPSPYEFHYSEFWRERLETELRDGTSNYINEKLNTDPDLAAHITIIYYRGVCVAGIPITEVFPLVPPKDYLSSIIGDYKDCLINIEKDPVYCVLNMLRVFRYIKDGAITSKKEAGQWGLITLPKELRPIISKVMENYKDKTERNYFVIEELLKFKEYISNEVQQRMEKY